MTHRHDDDMTMMMMMILGSDGHCIVSDMVELAGQSWMLDMPSWLEVVELI